jgi:L-asparaginase
MLFLLVGLGKKHDDETYERHKRQADEGEDNSKFNDIYIRLNQPDARNFAYSGISWDGKGYLPQGTVGAVVLDSTGTLCCATSTGGLTNKLPGRIGDTPTLGTHNFGHQLPAIGNIC